MNEKRLAGLEPAAVFAYFEDICAIPHGSKNTKAISDYLVDFAKKQELRYIQDEANNVILFGEGTGQASLLAGLHQDNTNQRNAAQRLQNDENGLNNAHFRKPPSAQSADFYNSPYSIAQVFSNIKC